MPEQQADYDSPWKEILEQYFPEFMAFFFPTAHAEVDWTQGYEFLDKELQQVVRDAELGRRFADKLVKLWRRNGQEAWVLVHIEVQGQYEADFAQRMYVYNYRLFDRYNRFVASFAVLADERPNWRPQQFGYQLWNSEVHFQFPVVKLLDYWERWQTLESSQNPFSLVVMAHLKAQETRQDQQERKTWKLMLTRQLYERGYSREEVIHLFRFIDWVIQLPEGLELEFWQAVQQYEEETRMPYITSVERLGIQKGRQEGRQEGRQQEAASLALRLISRRLGTVDPALQAQIQQLSLPQLEDLVEAVLDFSQPEDLETWLQENVE